MFHPDQYVEIIITTTQYRALQCFFNAAENLSELAKGQPLTGHFELADAIAAKLAPYPVAERDYLNPFATLHITLSREDLSLLTAQRLVEIAQSTGSAAGSHRSCCIIPPQAISEIVARGDFSMKMFSPQQAQALLAQSTAL